MERKSNAEMVGEAAWRIVVLVPIALLVRMLPWGYSLRYALELLVAAIVGGGAALYFERRAQSKRR